jgi:hypothetical protein
MPKPLLHAFLDESADEQRKSAFCVGAFLAAEPHWRAIEAEWKSRLTSDGIAYFRATDCKAASGPFFQLRKKYGGLPGALQAAERVRTDLEDLLLSFHWIGFGLGVVVGDYDAVLEGIPETGFFFAKDHTVAAYSQMMYEVARSVRKNAAGHEVTFVIDASSCGPKIEDAARAIKIIHPVIGSSIAGVAEANDKMTVSLQVADLVAGLVKDTFQTWLQSGKPRYLPLSARWTNHFEAIGTWDAEHMLRAFGKTLRSRRFAHGLLPSPKLPPVRKSIIKKARREMARQAMKDKQPTGSSGSAPKE